MSDLFTHALKTQPHPDQPLAERMRPKTLSEYVGQEHLLSEEGPLRSWVHHNRLPSMIFWGPPGVGKTTLAHLIAAATGRQFHFFSAVLSNVKEIREIIERAEESLKYHRQKTILFVDEIHRFNKAQQDAFLPHVERGTITLIGATTENPSFEVIPALLSRVRVLTLKPLSKDQLSLVLERALSDSERGLGGQGIVVDESAKHFLIESSAGDARQLLGTLEAAVGLLDFGLSTDRVIGQERVERALQHKGPRYDKKGEEHYNVISAFIKSMRGSNPDAALYWLARMLEAGEEPRFIARRMVIFASEDIGNADPQALLVATAAFQAYEIVGAAEGWIPLAHAATYLARAPKSNASYAGYKRAVEDVKKHGALPVPLHLRNAPTALMKQMGYGAGYQYPHNDPAAVTQEYLPDALRGVVYYSPLPRQK